MIGHPNSKAEESKIQIDAGLFVLYPFIYCVCVTFVFCCQSSCTLWTPVPLPMNLLKWPVWSTASWIDQYHTGQQIFLDTLQTDCERSNLTANPVLLQPCRSHFCFSRAVMTQILFLASPHPLSTGGMAIVILSPTSPGCSSGHILFSILSAWFSWQVLVRFWMFKIFLMCFSVCFFLPSRCWFLSSLLGTWGLSFSFSTSWRILSWSAIKYIITEAQNQYTVCLNTETGSQANWNLKHYFSGNTCNAYTIQGLRVLPIAFHHFMKFLTFLGISWNTLLHGLPVTYIYI